MRTPSDIAAALRALCPEGVSPEQYDALAQLLAPTKAAAPAPAPPPPPERLPSPEDATRAEIMTRLTRLCAAMPAVDVARELARLRALDEGLKEQAPTTPVRPAPKPKPKPAPKPEPARRRPADDVSLADAATRALLAQLERHPPKEVAAVLGCSTSSIANWRRGVPPGYRSLAVLDACRKLATKEPTRLRAVRGDVRGRRAPSSIPAARPVPRDPALTRALRRLAGRYALTTPALASALGDSHQMTRARLVGSASASSAERDALLEICRVLVDAATGQSDPRLDERSIELVQARDVDRLRDHLSQLATS